MAEITTKILLRQGTNEQRITAGGTGVTFDSGEPGFCIDTKRLFIGDGNTSGGWPIGIQNLGRVNQLLDSSGNFTAEAQTVINQKGASVGDIIYDNNTKLIWTFSSASYPPSPSDVVPFDTSIRFDTSQFTLNIDGQLQIKEGGIYSSNLDVGVVTNPLVKPSQSEPITIREQAVENKFLATMPTNSVKVNRSGFSDIPFDLPVNQNCVLGRRTGNIESIPTGDLLQNAILAGAGVTLDTVGTRVRINLDSTYIDATGASVTINTPLAINGQTGISGPLTVFDDLTVQGTVRAGQDIIAFTSSDLRMKEDLSVLSNALDKVISLTGYKFKYNSNAPKEIQGELSYGLLAQDVEKVLPLAVNNRSPLEDGTSYKGVNYDKIIPLLVESIKELNIKLERIKNCHQSNK
jgi:hypothetical protein